MKTDDLVSLLATGASTIDPKNPTRYYATAALAGTVAAAALTGALLGWQPALPQEMLQPMFWAREAFCASLGGVGLLFAARLSRPGARLGLLPVGFAVPVLAMWILAAASLLSVAPQDRAQLLIGQTAAACPFLIALVSAPLFVAFVWTMRALAPTRLRLAGAAGGFAAGAIGALVYTLHCPELAAPFIGLWYVLGMLIPAAVGVWLGPRLLRW